MSRLAAITACSASRCAGSNAQAAGIGTSLGGRGPVADQRDGTGPGHRLTLGRGRQAVRRPRVLAGKIATDAGQPPSARLRDRHRTGAAHRPRGPRDQPDLPAPHLDARRRHRDRRQPGRSPGGRAATPPVAVVGHQVSTPAGHGLAHKRTVLTGITGVAAAPAARIVAKVNAVTKAALVNPPGDLDVAAENDDTVSFVRADAHYVTLSQDRYFMYFEAAHGESWVDPLTFDRRTGALLTLHTFAAKGKEKALLHRLSVATRAALKKRGGDLLMYQDGTSPKYTNFASFEPLPAGMLVEFGQGAVDAEAAGPITVLVHWPTLKGLIGLPLPTKS